MQMILQKRLGSLQTAINEYYQAKNEPVKN